MANTKSDLLNFADDNTITDTFKNRDDLLRTLWKESESAVDWFRNNNKIADKFQAIIMNKRRVNQIMHKLKIYNSKIEIRFQLMWIFAKNRKNSELFPKISARWLRKWSWKFNWKEWYHHFKAINSINHSYMRNIFIPKRPRNITVRHHNTATYGDKSLTPLGPKIWNKLSTNIKALTSITMFKEYISTWFLPSCKCKLCRMVK